MTWNKKKIKCLLWQQKMKLSTLFVCLNNIYSVWWERPSNHRPNLFPILLQHQPLYFCSSSVSISLALCHSFFLTLSLSLHLVHWMWAQWTFIIFTALLKSPLNHEIPNATASCSHITHFTAIDAGSASSDTQRCCCI